MRRRKNPSGAAVGWAVAAAVVGGVAGSVIMHMRLRLTIDELQHENAELKKRALPNPRGHFDPDGIFIPDIPGLDKIPQLPSKPANPASVPGIPGNGGVLVIPPDLSQLIPGLFPKPVNVP